MSELSVSKVEPAVEQKWLPCPRCSKSKRDARELELPKGSGVIQFTADSLGGCFTCGGTGTKKRELVRGEVKVREYDGFRKGLGVVKVEEYDRLYKREQKRLAMLRGGDLADAPTDEVVAKGSVELPS